MGLRDYPHKNNNGEITVIKTFPTQLSKTRPTKFALLPEEVQKGVNKKRAERGYSPAELSPFNY